MVEILDPTWRRPRGFRQCRAPSRFTYVLRVLVYDFQRSVWSVPSIYVADLDLTKLQRSVASLGAFTNSQWFQIGKIGHRRGSLVLGFPNFFNQLYAYLHNFCFLWSNALQIKKNVKQFARQIPDFLFWFLADFFLFGPTV